MKISPVNKNLPQNTPSFGFDKRLNTKLIKKLEKTPQSLHRDLISRVNFDCNETEKIITKLEGKGGCRIQQNEQQINFLLEYFINAKTFVCSAVERFFPELNFTNKSIEAYDSETCELYYGENSKITEESNLKSAFSWRDRLIDELQDLINGIGYEDRIEADFDEETKGEYQNSRNSNLLEKFIPMSDSPKSLDEIVGLQESVDDIKDLIILPLSNPEEAKKREIDYGVKIPNFSVFFGPPGCGKTMLAQAIAAQTGCDMYSLDLSKVGSKYINEGVINVAKAFLDAEKAAKVSKKPIILFMDEMDSLLSTRHSEKSDKEDDKIVNILLELISNSKDKNIMLIGATNAYHCIDSAAKRRADFEAYIGLPDKDDIKKLLVRELSKIKMGEHLSKDDSEINKISQNLLGFSPANILNILQSVGKLAYKAKREIQAQDFTQAVKNGEWEKIDEKEYLNSTKIQKNIGFAP